jgi:hypothetical protein
VVAFLSKGKNNTWFTEGLSYGTRYPAYSGSEEEFAAVVKSALTSQKRCKAITSCDPMSPTVQWALFAASRRSTRWDGLYALKSASDPSHAHYDRRPRPDNRLAEDTLIELERIMVSTPSYDETLPQMLEILRDRNSAALTWGTADAIETVLHNSSAPQWFDRVLDLMEEHLSGRVADSPQPKDPFVLEWELARRGAGETIEARDQRVQKRWHELKSRFGIEPRVRDDFERIDETKTGGQTPP